MKDECGNEWVRLGHPLLDERCVQPGCPSRRRLGTDKCFRHNCGEPQWREEYDCWVPPERELHWCSLLDNRQLVWL
jgi:hypothetical protein